MPILVPCLKCKTKFQVPSKQAGKKVRCAACGFVMQLPNKDHITAKKQAAAATGGSKSPTTPPRPTDNRQSVPSRPPAPERKPAAVAEEEELIRFFDDQIEAPADNDAAAATTTPPTVAGEPATVLCSFCSGLLIYDPALAGQTVACPHCFNHLIMPQL